MTRTGNTGQVVTGVTGAFHNNFFKIQFDRKILNKDFLVYFLRLPDTQRIIISYAGASTIPDLNHSDFYRILIKIPSPKEQQKIASCLSSLDEIIKAQEDKIEQLKQHKRGLMQGLFPKIEN
jgi:type I restriction enzyme S subunit